MWYAVVNWWWWLTRKLFILSRCVTISRSCVLVVDNTVDGKDNMRRRLWIRWHYDVSLKLESLVFYSSLLASFSSFSTLMMSWTCYHIHWNCWTLKCAQHKHSSSYPALNEERSNWSDTSWCHQPPWSPTCNCPCHPQCRRPSTHMNLMLSDMLKEWKTLISTNITHSSQHITSLLQPKWYILLLATSLVFSSLLSLPSTLPSTTNSHVLNVVRQVESIKKLSCQPQSPQHIMS